MSDIWSPEPWYWNSYDGIFTGDARRGEEPYAVAWVDHLLPEDEAPHGDEIYGPRWQEARSNARRIPAAVNACRGFTTEELEALEPGELAQLYRTRRVRRERARFSTAFGDEVLQE